MEADRRTARTLIAINGGSYELSYDEGVDDLKRRIEEAVHAGGRFVDFAAEGRRMSLLITPRSDVVISVDEDAVPIEPELESPAAWLPDY